MAEKQTLRSINREPRHVPPPLTEAQAPPEVLRSANTGRTRPPVAERPVAVPAGIVRLGITIGPQELARARAAYVSDRGRVAEPPRSFARWVVRAVERHLERRPLERMAAAKGAQVPPLARERKVSNNIPVPLGLPERLKAAVEQEMAEGRENTVSGLVREAMTVAVSEALDRSGGTLPTLDGPLARGHRP